MFLVKFIPKYLIFFVASKWDFLCHYILHLIIVLKYEGYWFSYSNYISLLNSFNLGISFIIAPQGSKNIFVNANKSSGKKSMKESIEVKTDVKAQTLGGK